MRRSLTHNIESQIVCIVLRLPITFIKSKQSADKVLQFPALFPNVMNWNRPALI